MSCNGILEIDEITEECSTCAMIDYKYTSGAHKWGNEFLLLREIQRTLNNLLQKSYYIWFSWTHVDF